jgi:hypothetical protein
VLLPCSRVWVSLRATQQGAGQEVEGFLGCLCLGGPAPSCLAGLPRPIREDEDPSRTARSDSSAPPLLHLLGGLHCYPARKEPTSWRPTLFPSLSVLESCQGPGKWWHSVPLLLGILPALHPSVLERKERVVKPGELHPHPRSLGLLLEEKDPPVGTLLGTRSLALNQTLQV